MLQENSHCQPWNPPPSSRNFLFYKLIVPSIIQDKKLRIPAKLAKKVGDELSSVATLSLPDGRVWCVELRTVENKIWLDTGWQRFMEHYSIREGFFLVFRYQGGSNFNIHLFDLTNAEINYTSKILGNFEELACGKQYPEPHEEKMINSDSINILYSTPCLTPTSKNNDVDQHMEPQTPSVNSNRPSLRNLIIAYEESVFGFKKENRNAASFYGSGTKNDILQPPIPFVRNVRIKSNNDVKVTNYVYKISEEHTHLARTRVNLPPRSTWDIAKQFSEGELTNPSEEDGLHIRDGGGQTLEISKKHAQRTEYSELEPLAKRIKEEEISVQSVTQVTYKELYKKSPKKKNSSKKIYMPEGSRPEIYTDEHVKLLGECKTTWTLCVDGYDQNGKRIYDQVNGETCHQCRQKTLGLHTHCSICTFVKGQFCGDCLYMRYGENVLEANCNPSWVCPVCRGICNCSLCRKAKGWEPTGNLYRKVSSIGFRSVAHYLIQTRQSQPISEDPDSSKSGLMNESFPSACKSVPFDYERCLEEDGGANEESDDKIDEEMKEEMNCNYEHLQEDGGTNDKIGDKIEEEMKEEISCDYRHLEEDEGPNDEIEEEMKEETNHDYKHLEEDEGPNADKIEEKVKEKMNCDYEHLEEDEGPNDEIDDQIEEEMKEETNLDYEHLEENGGAKDEIDDKIKEEMKEEMNLLVKMENDEEDVSMDITDKATMD